MIIIIIITLLTLFKVIIIIKMEKSLLFIFDEIWPKTMYYSTGTLARFWSKFKIFLKIQF